MRKLDVYENSVKYHTKITEPVDYDYDVGLRLGLGLRLRLRL